MICYNKLNSRKNNVVWSQRQGLRQKKDGQIALSSRTIAISMEPHADSTEFLSMINLEQTQNQSPIILKKINVHIP